MRENAGQFENRSLTALPNTHGASAARFFVEFQVENREEFFRYASPSTASIEKPNRIRCGSKADRIRINADRTRINPGSKPNRSESTPNHILIDAQQRIVADTVEKGFALKSPYDRFRAPLDGPALAGLVFGMNGLLFGARWTRFQATTTLNIIPCSAGWFAKKTAGF